MNRESDLAALVERELESLGFEMVKLDIFSHGRKMVLRVFIDDPETGVTIDDCVKASKALGLALDGEELISGPYNLEVSSPGMNRPLSKPEHFRRFSGSTAKVEFTTAEGGRQTLTGEILGVEGNAVSIKGQAGTETIDIARIIKANLSGEKWDIGKKSREGKKSGRRNA